MYVCCGTIMLLCVLQFYILRKLIENELGEQEVGEDECYICSLSSRILVYKGQLTPGQVHFLPCVVYPAPVNRQVHLLLCALSPAPVLFWHVAVAVWEAW